VRLLLRAQTGGSGIAALALMAACVVPMAVPLLRKRWSYETRKLLHYTFIGVMASLLYLPRSTHYQSRIQYCAQAPALHLHWGHGEPLILTTFGLLLCWWYATSHMSCRSGTQMDVLAARFALACHSRCCLRFELVRLLLICTNVVRVLQTKCMYM
jgi:hypothetical protein